MTDFLYYSLIAGAFVGFTTGYLGSLMVLQKMALVGDALSHVALPGLALGILFNFDPFIGAFAFLFVAATLTWYLQGRTRLSFESIIGVLFVLALAIGILITPQPDLLEALFGDISKVSIFDAFTAIAVSLFVIVCTRTIYKNIVLSLVSEELATSTGINVKRTEFVYLLLVALVVAVGIKFTGTLLVGALVIVPAAAAKNVSSNLHRYAELSGIIGIVSVLSGILISNITAIPAGPLIVISGTVIFLLTIFGSS